MQAEVVLTPTESRKLIAKGVARLDIVRNALQDGIIVMHPSSSTYFIAEELAGHKPRTNVWACGCVTSKGLCVEMGVSTITKVGDDFRASWVIRNGILTSDIPLGSLLKEMGPKDVYIKGVNALDIQGNVGVLIGANSVERVTIGRALAARQEQGMNIVFPAGLEKLIPIPVEQAAGEAQSGKIDYSMGSTCKLIPCKGTVVTELRSIELLSGAAAVPIASGGLGGAEGAVVLLIKGTEEQVRTAINHAEQSKGAKLPSLRLASCYDCFRKNCPFPVGDKPWGW